MNIVEWDMANARQLADIYNEQIVDIPHCYAVSPEEFEFGLQCRRDDRHCNNLHSEKIIVGEKNSRIIGFAHLSMGECGADGERETGGYIHFLTYQAGNRPTGQAILAECEKYLRESGADQIWAFQKFCCYPFYHLGFGNVSDRSAHVYALFLMNGYRVNDGEIFMEAPEYNTTEPALPKDGAEIVVEHIPGRAALPGMIVRASRDDEEIGVCESGSAGEYCRSSEAQNRFLVEHLDVEEKWQGKGWGRYLLQKTRWEMRELGYRDAVISTDMTNHQALLFYANYGYRVTDTVYGFVKTL